MRKTYLAGLSVVILWSYGCEPTHVPSTNSPTKPVTYIPENRSLFSIVSPDGIDITQPWLAKDTDLINSIRTRARLPDDVIQPDATTSTTSPCVGGGSMTTTTNNQGPPWYSEGDVFTTVYNNCVRGNTQLSGQRSYAVEVMQGQQFVDPDWSLTTTMSRDLLKIDLLAGSENTVLGTATTAVTVTNSTQYSQTLQGGWQNERVDANGEPLSDSAEYLVTYEWDETPDGVYQWDFEVTTTSSNPVIPDTASRTLETLTGPNNLSPNAGKLEIIRTLEATTETTTVTALGDDRVLVEIDEDGDGTIDSSNETTWQQVVLDSFLYQFF